MVQLEALAFNFFEAHVQAVSGVDKVYLHLVPLNDGQWVTTAQVCQCGFFRVKAAADGRLMGTAHNEPTCQHSIVNDFHTVPSICLIVTSWISTLRFHSKDVALAG